MCHVRAGLMFVIVSAGICCVSTTSHAQWTGQENMFWTGAAGTDNWADAGNWSSGVPNAATAYPGIDAAAVTMAPQSGTDSLAGISLVNGAHLTLNRDASDAVLQIPGNGNPLAVAGAGNVLTLSSESHVQLGNFERPAGVSRYAYPGGGSIMLIANDNASGALNLQSNANLQIDSSLWFSYDFGKATLNMSDNARLSVGREVSLGNAKKPSSSNELHLSGNAVLTSGNSRGVGDADGFSDQGAFKLQTQDFFSPDRVTINDNAQLNARSLQLQGTNSSIAIGGHGQLRLFDTLAGEGNTEWTPGDTTQQNAIGRNSGLNGISVADFGRFSVDYYGRAAGDTTGLTIGPGLGAGGDNVDSFLDLRDHATFTVGKDAPQLSDEAADGSTIVTPTNSHIQDLRLLYTDFANQVNNRAELRIHGPDVTANVSGNFIMNAHAPSMPDFMPGANLPRLVADISADTHSPLVVGGTADIANGDFYLTVEDNSQITPGYHEVTIIDAATLNGTFRNVTSPNLFEKGISFGNELIYDNDAGDVRLAFYQGQAGDTDLDSLFNLRDVALFDLGAYGVWSQGDYSGDHWVDLVGDGTKLSQNLEPIPSAPEPSAAGTVSEDGSIVLDLQAVNLYAVFVGDSNGKLVNGPLFQLDAGDTVPARVDPTSKAMQYALDGFYHDQPRQFGELTFYDNRMNAQDFDTHVNFDVSQLTGDQTLWLMYQQQGFAPTLVDLLAHSVLAGDYNHNGVVDAADYTVWKDHFGSTSDLDADGSGNGVIDAADYTVWKDNFGAVASATSRFQSVPEPAAGGCLLFLIVRVVRLGRSRSIAAS
ncbi:MAG: hypothetical protein R3E01_10045 [Pirellulaceae bacterium]|nr:hypothetical protein [Planctomycetales bacterium]